MYCPRCGHQPVSNELRFCSYCGFKLGVVKASLAEDEETRASTGSTAEPVNTPPRPGNINIGVITMFLGGVLAILLSGRGAISREGAAMLLTAFFAVTLLFSSLHPQGNLQTTFMGRATAGSLTHEPKGTGVWRSPHVPGHCAVGHHLVPYRRSHEDNRISRVRAGIVFGVAREFAVPVAGPEILDS